MASAAIEICAQVYSEMIDVLEKQEHPENHEMTHQSHSLFSKKCLISLLMCLFTSSKSAK